MRRPGRVERGGKVELVSVALAKESIADADVVALLVDAKGGVTDQDAAIGGEADRAGRGIVIVANKWDLVKVADATFVKKFDEEIRRRMKFLDYAPILHISALTGERASKLIETIERIAVARRVRVPTPALNRFVGAVTAAREDSLRRADRRRAAVVRLLHECRYDVSLLVSAFSRQQAARRVRVRGIADPCAGSAAEEVTPSSDGLPLPTYMTAGAAGKDLHAAVPDDLAIEPGTIVLVPITDRARGGFGHSAV